MTIASREKSVPEPTEAPVRPRIIACAYAVAAVASLAALYDSGAGYNDYQIQQGGVHWLLESEVVFYFWYALWGSLAALFGALALMHTRLPERVLGLLTRVLARPLPLVAAAALVVLLGASLFRGLTLLDQAVADDEATYAFQAETLLQGRIVNPAPELPTYYKNQFVQIDEHGWFGQYPLGHPLVLALGELLHLRAAIIPLLGLCSVFCTFALGLRLFEPKRAALGALLLALSPQWVWTHATLLSQPSSVVFMLLGLLALLRLQDEGRLIWALLSGCAWGAVVLIRPMPGVLLVAAAFAAHAHGLVRARAWGRLSQQLLAAAPGVFAAAAIIALTNYVESGNPFVAAYKTLHGGYGAVPTRLGLTANSLGGALVRQNFWLFGWTLSFVFLPFARPRRGALLFWGMIAADYAYRLIVPKTVVGTTGPIYVFEAVPFLALATADGAVRLSGWLKERLQIERARAWIAAGALASWLVALAAFVPVMARAANLSSIARVRVFDLLEATHASHALVFANHLVLPERVVTWAYFPPNPSPTLDDQYLFVRQPRGAGGPRKAYEFWMREYPTRRAFLYEDSWKGQLFTELQPGQPPPEAASLRDLVEPR